MQPLKLDPFVRFLSCFGELYAISTLMQYSDSNPQFAITFN